MTHKAPSVTPTALIWRTRSGFCALRQWTRAPRRTHEVRALLCSASGAPLTPFASVAFSMVLLLLSQHPLCPPRIMQPLFISLYIFKMSFYFYLGMKTREQQSQGPEQKQS